MSWKTINTHFTQVTDSVYTWPLREGRRNAECWLWTEVDFKRQEFRKTFSARGGRNRNRNRGLTTPHIYVLKHHTEPCRMLPIHAIQREFYISFEEGSARGQAPRPDDHYGDMGFCVGTSAPLSASPGCILCGRDLSSPRCLSPLSGELQPHCT